MAGEFNIHAARRLEARQLATMREAFAVQRSEELNRLLCAFAAKGGTFSTSILNEEVKIIFASAEEMIDKAIANRMEMSTSAPELLIEQPYLRDFRGVLHEIADGAVISVQQRHAGPAPAGRFPDAALNAVLREAEKKAKTLKNRIDLDIDKLALKGMATRSDLRQPAQQITNVFQSSVANVAQHSSQFTQNAVMSAESKAAGLSVEAQIALATLVVSVLGAFAAWLTVPGFLK